MPLLAFEGPRQRIYRANTHRHALADAWNSFIQEDFYTGRIKVNPDGTGTLRISQDRDFPDLFSFELGETLYQLRAALDGIVYAAAILDSGGQDPPPNEHRLEFPICATKGEFDVAAGKKLWPLSKKRKAIIQAVQPYNAPELALDEIPCCLHVTLGILNDWALSRYCWLKYFRLTRRKFPGLFWGSHGPTASGTRLVDMSTTGLVIGRAELACHCVLRLSPTCFVATGDGYRIFYMRDSVRLAITRQFRDGAVFDHRGRCVFESTRCHGVTPFS